MDLSLFFAGTAGSVPTARRGLPALLLRAGGERILFDCGEGTQQQLLRSVGLPELDAIFITHYHLDHWLGVLGMLKTFDLRAREKPLTIYGPPGLQALFACCARGRAHRLPARARRARAARGGPLRGLLIAPFPVEHRVEAYGYAFVEDDRPGRFDAEAARALGVAEGPGLRALQRGETVGRRAARAGIGEDRPGRRIVISGDTAPCQAVEVFAHEADVLVHEATFLEDERARARETGHSTAAQAAEIARDAGVRLLALTHLSTRYFPREIRDEARAVFRRPWCRGTSTRSRSVPGARGARAGEGRPRARPLRDPPLGGSGVRGRELAAAPDHQLGPGPSPAAAVGVAVEPRERQLGGAQPHERRIERMTVMPSTSASLKSSKPTSAIRSRTPASARTAPTVLRLLAARIAVGRSCGPSASSSATEASAAAASWLPIRTRPGSSTPAAERAAW